MPSQAQQADFFGTSDPFQQIGTGVQRPARTLAQMQEEERQRIAANLARGLDANGNQLPAYGTPVSQGGTATGYQVTHQTNTHTTGGAGNDVRQTGPVDTISGIPNNGINTPAGAAGGKYSIGDIVHNGQVSGNALADEVLGSQPTVNQNNAVTTNNRDRLTPVIDPNLASSPETERALALSEDLVNRITGAPLQSELLGDQMLSQSLLQARSARGGAGATQNALDNAIAQAPEQQRVASQQMTNEQVQRAGAAGQAASIYAGVATNDANRAERIAQANQSAGLQVLNNLTTLTGFDYQFDTAKMNAVGQLARDFFNNSAQFAQMDTQMQIAQWNNMTTRYGIDATLKAAMEKISADEGIGPLDAFKLVLGAATGAAALGAAF